jgi:hypothetical protein
MAPRAALCGPRSGSSPIQQPRRPRARVQYTTSGATRRCLGRQRAAAPHRSTHEARASQSTRHGRLKPRRSHTQRPARRARPVFILRGLQVLRWRQRRAALFRTRRALRSPCTWCKAVNPTRCVLPSHRRPRGWDCSLSAHSLPRPRGRMRGGAQRAAHASTSRRRRRLRRKMAVHARLQRARVAVGRSSTCSPASGGTT